MLLALGAAQGFVAAREGRAVRNVRIRGALSRPSRLGVEERRGRQLGADSTSTPKAVHGVLAVAVGAGNRAIVTRMARTFLRSKAPGCSVALILFPYDDYDWKQTFKWASSPRVKFIRDVDAAGATYKWLLARDFLGKELLAGADYLFFWDDDIDVAGFDPCAYMQRSAALELKVSQPALVRKASGSPWPCASAYCGNLEKRPGCDFHYSSIIEVMVPVYAVQTWLDCVQPKLVGADKDPHGTGWGVDFNLHNICGCGFMYVIDRWPVRHLNRHSLKPGKAAKHPEKWYAKHAPNTCHAHAEFVWKDGMNDPNERDDQCLTFGATTAAQRLSMLGLTHSAAGERVRSPTASSTAVPAAIGVASQAMYAAAEAIAAQRLSMLGLTHSAAGERVRSPTASSTAVPAAIGVASQAMYAAAEAIEVASHAMDSAAERGVM